MSPTYNYETGSGCANNYPIETYQQMMYTAGGELILIDGLGSQRGPWGDGGITYVKNEDKKNELPTKLKVAYYSYVEDKFYEGEFNLPTNKIEKYLQEKSNKPSKENKIYDKYNRIEIGFAIGGMVNIWMKGDGDQTKLSTFYAKESFPKWENIFGKTNREEEVKDRLASNMYSLVVKEEILTNHLPMDRWKNYDHAYNYTIKTILPANAKIVRFYSKMINAEAFTTYQNLSEIKGTKAIPYNIDFIWTYNGKTFNTRIIFGNNKNYYNTIYKSSQASMGDNFPIDFTQEEIYQAFNKIYANKELELLIEIDESNTGKIFIKNDANTINLKDIIIKTFEQ